MPCEFNYQGGSLALSPFGVGLAEIFDLKRLLTLQEHPSL